MKRRLVSWDRSIGEPVVLPNGKKITTLRAAAKYLQHIPKSEHDHPAVQAAIQVLMHAVQSEGPTMLARIGVKMAIHRHRPPDPPSKAVRERPWMKPKRRIPQ